MAYVAYNCRYMYHAAAGLVVCVAHTIVHRREVKVHLARVFGLELFHLQVDHNETVQP